jgi:hypothetical protein
MAESAGVPYEDVKTMLLAGGLVTDSHLDVPGHDGQKGFGGRCLPSTAKITLDSGAIITMDELHERVSNGERLRIQSVMRDGETEVYRVVKSTTRRTVDEGILVFSTSCGNFRCTKEHLMPILRDGTLQIVRADEVLRTDEFLSL